MLRERWRVLVLVTAFFAGLAWLLDARFGTIYTSTATVEVSPLTAEAPFGVGSFALGANPGALARSVGAALQDRQVQADVFRRLARRGRRISPGSGFVVSSAGPQLVRLGVTHSDPVEGARTAQAVAEAVVAHLNAEQRRQIGRLIEGLRRQRRRAAVGLPAGGFLARIRTISSRVELERVREARRLAQPATIVSDAEPPDDPSISPGRRVLPMTVLGLGLALIVAFLLDVVERRPRELRRLGSASGLPMAGLVPKLGRRRADDLDAFGHLRAAIGGMFGEPGVVLVSSPGPQAGKTTVAVGLAEAAAAQGRSACVVEADLRRPVLAERLALAGPGMVDVVEGTVDLEDAIVRTPAPPGSHVPGPALLPAGQAAARPGELLRSAAVDELLDRLRASFELVVLDSPPLLAAADAQVLARRADAMLVCARVGTTTTDELTAARRILGNRWAGHAALVLTAAPDLPARTRGLAAGRSRWRAFRLRSA